jgi:hypothetical protein
MRGLQYSNEHYAAGEWPYPCWITVRTADPGYLGHRSIVSTQRYTALAPDRFKNFWKD